MSENANDLKNAMEGVQKKERKPRKPRNPPKKDSFFLAVRSDSEENGTNFVLILGAINFGNQRDISITNYPSKITAFQAAKRIPDFLEKNDVRIISVSNKITLTKRVIEKVSM